MVSQDVRLRELWNEMRSAGQVSKRFKSLVLFRAWALENGFREGSTIERKDPSGAFSEENCFVSAEESEDEDNELERDIAGWDRVADLLRQRLGLPPIMTGSPCPGCPKEETCSKTDDVCDTRLRSWDAMTERLKNIGR